MDNLNLPVSPNQPVPTDVVLTRNLIDILPELLRGLPLSAIAKKVGCGPRGIARRTTQIYLCFNVKDRVQLLHRAVTVGLHFKDVNDNYGCYSLKLDYSTSAFDARK